MLGAMVHPVNLPLLVLSYREPGGPWNGVSHEPWWPRDMPFRCPSCELTSGRIVDRQLPAAAP